jgi:hypothetical protein
MFMGQRARHLQPRARLEITMLTLAIAVLVAQADAEPKDEISDHIRWNIKVAARSGDSAAIVTIASATAQTVKLHVDQNVVGELPDELSVSTRTFAKPDLEGGTQLLVFFHNKQPTGHYELVTEGKIREYPVEVYLTRARWELSQVNKSHAAQKKPTPAPTVAQLGQPSRS